MESAARDDSAPAAAADSARDAFGYVISEARSMSSSDNESGVSEKESPSQYRMEEMAVMTNLLPATVRRRGGTCRR